jgi:ankyrin repeat protein
VRLGEIVSSHLDLKDAIARRDLSEIAKLVNHRDVIRSWPDDDMKPLAYAAKYGDVATVEELLRHGVDVNETEQDGQTALLVAASADREDTAKVLLDNGARADCAYTDRDDLDPLIIAAKLGSNRVLKLCFGMQ